MTTRVTTSFTSVSWIPSEAMTGLMRLPMDVGVGRYDDPPPDLIDDVESFVAEGRCRFANRLDVWAEIEPDAGGGPRIVATGSTGGGLVAPTEVDLKAMLLKVPAVAFPEIRSTETNDDGSVTVVQTAGGRTGAPLPRRAGRRGLPRLKSPTAWTTVAITIRPDGSSSGEIRGASAFPRHFFYDDELRLTGKSATIDFADWTSGIHDQDTPWGDTDRVVRSAEVESELERSLSTAIMRGERAPVLYHYAEGEALMTQGEPADSIGLILDGVVEVEVDGTVVAECGPGCVIGERAFLEDRVRTATLRALTPVRFAETTPDTFNHDELAHLRSLHQRELDTDPKP